MLNETPRLEKSCLRRRTRDRRSHGVTVVLDHVDDRKLPQLGHIEAFVDLALVGRAVAEIGDADAVIAPVAVRKGKTRSERNLRPHNAVSTVEMLLLAEHVHGAALALGISAAAPGQLGHHTSGVHAACEHVAMIAIPCNDLIALFQGHLHADDDSFLPDVKMAEPADRTHAVKLPGLFLETPDQQHVAQRAEFLIFRKMEISIPGGRRSPLPERRFFWQRPCEIRMRDERSGWFSLP